MHRSILKELMTISISLQECATGGASVPEPDPFKGLWLESAEGVRLA